MGEADRLGKSLCSALKEWFPAGSSIVLPFSYDVLEQICYEEGISYAKAIEQVRNYFDWKTINSLAVALSICAVEVAESYKCDSENYEAYNSSLADSFSLSTSQLQSRYNGGQYYCTSLNNVQYYTFQDYLWGAAALFVKEKAGLSLKIPRAGEQRNRYVQYPFSQRLLKKSTIENYESHFKNIGIGQGISFEEFKERLKVWSLNLTNNKLTYKELQSFQNHAFHILFYCYCNWEVRKQESPIKRAKNKDRGLFIYCDTTKHTFHIEDINRNEISSLTQEEIIPFAFDSEYFFWTSISRIEEEGCYGILVHQMRKLSNQLEKVINQENIFRKGDFLFFILPDDFNKKQLPESLLPRKRGYKFVGGLKNSAGVWLKGFLPLLVLDKTTPIVVDGKVYSSDSGILDLNSINLQIGTHLIRIKAFSNIEFKVGVGEKPSFSNRGWKWGFQKVDFVSDEDWILSGLNWRGFKFTNHDSRGMRKISRMEIIAERFERIKERW